MCGTACRVASRDLDSPAEAAAPLLSPKLSSERHCEASIRSEEHTSELQSRSDLVCRLLLEKKKSKRAAHRVSIQRCALPHEQPRLRSSTARHTHLARTRSRAHRSTQFAAVTAPWHDTDPTPFSSPSCSCSILSRPHCALSCILTLLTSQLLSLFCAFMNSCFITNFTFMFSSSLCRFFFFF